MKLRRAFMDDALDVLAWRNDSLATAMSKSHGTVAFDDHMKWFSEAIQDPNRVLLVATEDEKRLGIVRFDKTGDRWLVSINLAPGHRGKGYGSAILKEAVAVAQVGPLLAEIRKTNAASIHIFEKCGFRFVGAEGDFEYWSLSS